MIRDNDNKLYQVQNRLGTFYIVAKSFDAAAEAVKERLDKADYGFSAYREIKKVELLAAEHFFGERQSFSSDDGNLIVTGG